jgi:RHS repeat-associated protein
LAYNGSSLLQDVKHTWDAAGNLTQRQDIVSSETESFAYDYLDRLTSVSGPYSESYTYDPLGNIMSKNGTGYTYNTNGVRPHAVTAVGSTGYSYDPNGNMTNRGSQTIGWDVENRVVSVSGGASFVYDGNGNRVKKTEGGQTTLYVNRYFEKNLSTSEVTTSYYLGGKLIAQRKGTTLSYILQDHLGSNSVTTEANGNNPAAIRYFAFGATRSTTGILATDKKFTGQTLDQTGLYYYGARYYDANIGRFISPDTIVPDPMNPQSLNRYSYCLNNPLKYIDPSGRTYEEYMRIYGGQVGNGGGVGSKRVRYIKSGIGYIQDGSTFYFIEENGFIQPVDMEDMDSNMKMWLEEAQNGLIVFDVVGDIINLGIDSKKGDTFAATLDAFSIFLYGSLRNLKWIKEIPSIKLLNPPINITREGWNHVFNFHISPSIPRKSKWALNVDVVQLIQDATQHPMVLQKDGKYARIVDAGRNIGIDVATGKDTSYYTVITTRSGDLVNAFPGMP